MLKTLLPSVISEKNMAKLVLCQDG